MRKWTPWLPSRARRPVGRPLSEGSWAPLTSYLLLRQAPDQAGPPSVRSPGQRVLTPEGKLACGAASPWLLRVRGYGFGGQLSISLV